MTFKIHFESPKLVLFDELSPDGGSKSSNYWPKTLLLRTHTACYAKSEYSLMHVHRCFEKPTVWGGQIGLVVDLRNDQVNYGY